MHAPMISLSTIYTTYTIVHLCYKESKPQGGLPSPVGSVAAFFRIDWSVRSFDRCCLRFPGNVSCRIFTSTESHKVDRCLVLPDNLSSAVPHRYLNNTHRCIHIVRNIHVTQIKTRLDRGENFPSKGHNCTFPYARVLPARLHSTTAFGND